MCVCVCVCVCVCLVFVSLLGRAPPRLSAVRGWGCFYGSLAESSSHCLEKWPPHLTLSPRALPPPPIVARRTPHSSYSSCCLPLLFCPALFPLFCVLLSSSSFSTPNVFLLSLTSSLSLLFTVFVFCHKVLNSLDGLSKEGKRRINTWRWKVIRGKKRRSITSL